ncbi:uncharacterized protein LOC107793393 [Nicotiana tabacum]|uniref:Uncharacterized protein LOC107793393 n=1 Tax=Nicotiana tabacum TaxID=4097 RepID=A0AC58TP27_TOBAC
MDFEQVQEEDDDESTVGNFREVAMKADLSPRVGGKSADIDMPWIVGGDFNVVLHEDEKIGGLPVYPPEYEDFALCVNSCGLFDIGYNGSPFTWWNGRPNDQCIFKRLDRIFVNLSYQNLFPNIEVQYLIRTCSDHAPLLMSCGHEAMQFVKHFKFLNFWATHDTFTEVVRQKWVTNFIGDPFLMFKQKLKRLKSTLSQWSKLTFGDIFKQLAIREDIVRVKEILFEEEPTIQNRIVLQQAHAELKKYLSIEEQYWKQKAGLNWFAEGDRNTRCFHNHVNEFFKNQFTQESDTTFFELLNNVPSMVTTYQNSELCRYPTLEEVKKAIFALSGDSTSGPDGFTGLFYQKCWNIVGADIFMMVQDIYGGASLPKSITHTNLVLLPKKPQVQTFSDLRPISLSNFINKVISRVLHDRMEKVLPSLISPNQSGFVKGRSIFENILLTQEIITDIRMNGKPKNMVIKLDMAKAYDSVNWKYLLQVLRKMGFAEHFINMIGNLLINNWYSVLINGQTSGFSNLVEEWSKEILCLLHCSFYQQRTPKSLWSNFTWNKYCKKKIPTLVQFKDGSHVWRKILKSREEVEHEVLWQMNRGSTNVWHENWTGIGAIYHVVPPDFNINEELHEVTQLRTENGWDDQLLHHTFPEDITYHIRQEICFDDIDAKWDTPKWMPMTLGKFTVSSAWNIVRHREPTNHEQKNLWTKGLPFKIRFFLWRLWRGKIPTDDLWRRDGYHMASKCWCCFPPHEETLNHIFLTNSTVSRVWKVFLHAAKIMVNLIQLHQVIRAWWNAECYPKLRPLYQATPTIIS